jgi:hypothetical protein
MEERYGVRGTMQDGIFFTEAPIPGAKVLRHVHAEISRQNATLTEVKARLAADVKAAGGSALASFQYGQKKHSWSQLLALKWDTESWHGEGDAVIR